MIDLEKFPTSESAKRMLTYVTEGWYDRSYVGKWLYQVMGYQLDETRGHIEEIPEQLFVETATWGLRYHELKYGLPVREDLSYEERRSRIIEVRDTKAPMTPWRMEKILSGATGYLVSVYDIHDHGPFQIDHPNKFVVEVEGSGRLSMKDVVDKVRALKQSHTVFDLVLQAFLIENQNEWEQKIIYRVPISWRNKVLDGAWLLDGKTLMDAVYPTVFRPGFRIALLSENASHVLERFRFAQRVGDELAITDIHRFRMNWWEGERVLDGELTFDGSERLNQERAPMLRAPRYRIRTVETNEPLFNMYIPAKAAKMDGTVLMDGTINLNSGREVL